MSSAVCVCVCVYVLRGKGGGGVIQMLVVHAVCSPTGAQRENEIWCLEAKNQRKKVSLTLTTQPGHFKMFSVLDDANCSNCSLLKE